MSHDAPLPLEPELWMRQPAVHPFHGHRRTMVTAITVLVVLGALLAGGLIAPRWYTTGGGSGTGGARHEYVAAFVENASLRPWTIVGATAGGESIAAQVIPGAEMPDQLVDTDSVFEPYTVGVGRTATVIVIVPRDEPDCDGTGPVRVVQPELRIEVDTVAGRLSQPVGIPSSTTYCAAP
jgi:hypothetical protein